MLSIGARIKIKTSIICSNIFVGDNGTINGIGYWPNETGCKEFYYVIKFDKGFEHKIAIENVEELIEEIRSKAEIEEMIKAIESKRCRDFGADDINFAFSFYSGSIETLNWILNKNIDIDFNSRGNYSV